MLLGLVGLLGLALWLFDHTDWDLRVQDLCYNFEAQRWLVDQRAEFPRLLFYKAPKYLIIAVGVGFLLGLASPAVWRQRLRLTAPRPVFLVALLTLALVPALIGWLKATTGVHCPWDHIRYGGSVMYLHTFEGILQGHPAGTPCGRCFPAGHASGGFALLGLCALARTRRQWLLAFLAAQALGWTMGLYQTLKGAHYLSHTVATMLLAAILYLTIRQVVARFCKSGVNY